MSLLKLGLSLAVVILVVGVKLSHAQDAQNIVQQCISLCNERTNCSPSRPSPGQRSCYLAAACVCKCAIDNIINAGVRFIDENQCRAQGMSVSQCAKRSLSSYKNCVIQNVGSAKALESEVPVISIR